MESRTEVSVIDTTGNEIVGDVVGISASTLTLTVDGNRREFRESDVLRVTRPPHGMSRVVGGLIGAGVGFGGFMAIIGVCYQNVGTCDYEVLGAFVPMVAGGAAVGALATGRTDERLLFRSPNSVSRASSTVSVAPMVSKTAKGARLAIRW